MPTGDEHDPMRLLTDLGADDLPPTDPWTSLARAARDLAATAEHYASTDPADLAPWEDDQGDEVRDPLAELDDTALAIRSIVAACRRHTYQTLVTSGMTAAQIAQRWGVQDQSVRKVLRGPK